MNVWQLLAHWLLLKHQKKQEKIAEDVERAVAYAWRYVQFADVDTSQVPFLDVAVPKIEAGFHASQQATASFLKDYRAVALASQGVDAESRPTLRTEAHLRRTGGVDMRQLKPLIEGKRPSGVDMDQVQHLLAPKFNPLKTTVDLMSAGAGGVKRSMPAPEDVAMSNGLTGVTGVGVRNAMDGGRGVALSEAQEDEYAIGWQRVTDADPCHFCALLAANGPVYNRRSSFAKANKKFDPNLANIATGEPKGIAKVHNFCRCQLVPVFEGFENEDPWGKVALQIWRKVADEGYSGKEAMKEYRRLYTQNLKSADPLAGDSIDALEVKKRVYEELRIAEPGGIQSRVLKSQLSKLEAA